MNRRLRQAAKRTGTPKRITTTTSTTMITTTTTTRPTSGKHFINWKKVKSLKCQVSISSTGKSLKF